MSTQEILANLQEAINQETSEQNMRVRKIVEETLAELLPELLAATKQTEAFSASSKDVCDAVGCSLNTLYAYIGAGILDERHFILHRSGDSKSKVGKFSFRLNAAVAALQQNTKRLRAGEPLPVPASSREDKEQQSSSGGGNVVQLNRRRA